VGVKKCINKEKRQRKPLQSLIPALKLKPALADLRKYWDNLLSIYAVDSGDDRIDRMVNIWNSTSV